MSDDPNNEQPDPNVRPAGGVTESGFSYDVIDDDASADASAVPPPSSRSARNVSPLLLAALAIVPALIVGIGVWFLASSMNDDGGGGSDRLEQNVTNVVNAFSQSGEGGGVLRYEGELPPTFPDDVPLYPGGRVISSIVQIRGDDAGYIVVFDTGDARQDVANYFGEALNEDPWQIQVEQTGRESTVMQFSSVENPNIEGVVLAAESKDDDATTIFMSLNLVGGGTELEAEPFEAGNGRPLPSGFPAEDVPPYPDATIIETGYQQSPEGRQYIASMITEDEPSAVLDFYRQQFESLGWTVEDVPEGSSTFEDGVALSFTSEDGTTTGVVEAGAFPDDDAYTRANVQVAAPN